MAYVVRSSLLLHVPAEVAFDRLADHDSWPRWMAASFRPAGKSAGRLTEGAVFHVKIRGMLPATCKVSVALRPRELTWCGGVKRVLWAEHRFLFEPRGEADVEVTSVESWHGPVAALLRPLIAPGAKKVGREQLAALAASLLA
jgi:hypothetical protein